MEAANQPEGWLQDRLRGVAGRRATSLTKIMLAEFNAGKFVTGRREVGLNTPPNQR